MGILFLIFLVMILGIVAVHISQKNKKQPEKTSQPTHFDLLDDNGDPIKKHKIKVVVGNCSDAPVQELQYFCIKDKGYHVTVWPKNHSQFDIVQFNIAGLTHRDNIDKYLGESVGILMAEPDNPYDPNAIKVLASDGHHVGYVPKDMTDEVRQESTIPCPCWFYIGCNEGTYFSECFILRQ
jgi:hypothetical protein